MKQLVMRETWKWDGGGDVRVCGSDDSFQQRTQQVLFPPSDWHLHLTAEGSLHHGAQISEDLAKQPEVLQTTGVVIIILRPVILIAHRMFKTASSKDQTNSAPA